MATLKSKHSKKLSKDVYYIVHSHPVIDRDGNRVYKSKWLKVGTSKTKAKAALKEFNEDVKNKEDSTVRDVDLEFLIRDEFLPWCESTKTTDNFTSYRYRLELFLKYSGNRQLSDVNVRHIEKYRIWRKNRINEKGKRPSHNTINKDIKCLSHCFKKAIEWELTEKNPFTRIKPLDEEKPEVRFFSLDEINRILEVANPYQERFFIMGICTGMRRKEMLNLRLSDIDLNNNVIHITNRKDFKTKSRKSRDVPIPSMLLSRMSQYMLYWVDRKGEVTQLRTKDQQEYLFCHQDGRKLDSFKNSYATMLKNADVKNAHVHTMRHTYASHLAMAGQSIKAIQELLGHSDIMVTQMYAHLIPEYKHEVVKSLPYLLPDKTITDPINSIDS